MTGGSSLPEDFDVCESRARRALYEQTIELISLRDKVVSLEAENKCLKLAMHLTDDEFAQLKDAAAQLLKHMSGTDGSP